MGCGKLENGVRAAVGGVGQCVWCGSSENGVWNMRDWCVDCLGRVEVAMCMVCEPHGWSLRVVTLVWEVCGSNEEGSVIVKEQ